MKTLSVKPPILLLLVMLVLGPLSATANGAEAVFVPHMTGTSQNWLTWIVVDNNGTTAATFTLTYYDQGSQVHQETISISALAQDSYYFPLSFSVECAMISYTSSNLSFRAGYESQSQGVAEFKLDDVSSNSLCFYFSDFTPMVQWKGIAFSNMGSASTTVTLTALGDGAVLGSTSIGTVGPYQHVSGVFSRWFPTVALAQIDRIVATSPTGQLCGVAISGSSDNSRLLFTQAEPLDYTPPAPVGLTGTYTGTWHSTFYSDSGNITLSLVHQGNSLTGTLTLTNTECGTVTTAISGDTNGSIDLRGYYQCKGADIQIWLDATASGNTIQGWYDIYADFEPYDAGTFSISK